MTDDVAPEHDDAAPPDAEEASPPDGGSDVAPGMGAAGERPKRHVVRRVSAWVLVVVASVLLPLSVVTVWAVRTVENTNHYVETLQPLAENRVITDYVANQATTKLFTSLNVQQRIENALPAKASFVAAPVTIELRTFTENQIAKLLATQWFANLWRQVNTRTHAEAVSFLRGGSSPKLQKAQDVSDNLTPVLTKAIDALDQRGITVFNPLKQKLASGQQVQVVLETKQQVGKIRTAYRLAGDLAWWVPALALVLVVLAAIVAVDRRKVLLRIAVGTGLFDLVLLGGLALGRTFTVQHTAGRVSPEVTAAVFDTLLRYLRHGLRLELLIVLLVAVALWLAGPSSWARWIRRQVAAGARWAGQQFRTLNTAENRASVGSGARRTARWTLAHQSGMRIAGVVVAGIVIIFGGNLSPGGVFWTLVGLVIYLVLLQVVVVWARRTAALGGTGAEGTPGPTAGAEHPEDTGGPGDAAAVASDTSGPKADRPS